MLDLTLRRWFTTNLFWRQETWESRPVFFQLNTCGYSPYETFSLTRGRVCRLQLLLGLDSAVILGSESSRTHYHFYCLRLWTPPNLEGQVPYLYSPGTGFPFHRLLRLEGLRWRYSNPPPHWLNRKQRCLAMAKRFSTETVTDSLPRTGIYRAVA
jgi:hypothetical protein